MSKSIITPEAILSYPNLFEPRAVEEGQKPKYSCALVFPEGTDLSELKKAAVEVAIEKWGPKAKEMIRKGQLRTPFRDDWEAKGYPEGSTFMNVRSTRQPGIVSIYPDPKNGGRPKPIEDPEEIYAGIIVMASLSPFAYDTAGNRGVSFGLNNLQKRADGERLDGRVPAGLEFEADEDAAADLSDLGVDQDGEEDGGGSEDPEEGDLSDLL